jgi:hypothetical protein
MRLLIVPGMLALARFGVVDACERRGQWLRVGEALP